MQREYEMGAKIQFIAAIFEYQNFFLFLLEITETSSSGISHPFLLFPKGKSFIFA